MIVPVSIGRSQDHTPVGAGDPTGTGPLVGLAALRLGGRRPSTCRGLELVLRRAGRRSPTPGSFGRARAPTALDPTGRRVPLRGRRVLGLPVVSVRRGNQRTCRAAALRHRRRSPSSGERAGVRGRAPSHPDTHLACPSQGAWHSTGTQRRSDAPNGRPVRRARGGVPTGGRRGPAPGARRGGRGPVRRGACGAPASFWLANWGCRPEGARASASLLVSRLSALCGASSGVA
ncbi:hypothetical protein BMG523Draft_04765 [Frankia sp. BMG5.23]|nr:hypothetical protein BMG523Draft_04765 [Frankia sp. BMG5.23]